jgi:hypothetical protein
MDDPIYGEAPRPVRDIPNLVEEAQLESDQLHPYNVTDLPSEYVATATDTNVKFYKW